MRQLRPVRAMLSCYFCGGRVIPTKQLTHRCEAEGVTWAVTANLTIYRHGRDPRRVGQLRDGETGKFVRVNPIRK